jgi:hypothetical protein
LPPSDSHAQPLARSVWCLAIRLRSREIRPSNKVVARRVSEDDHLVLKRFAEARGTKIAEMIAPAVEELIEQARAFCNEMDDQEMSATAQPS